MVKFSTETENKDQELKHLGFVKIGVLHMLILVSSVYEYVKQNSRSLKSGIGTVEGAVRTVLGPVYEKFHAVPFDLLVFCDEKVDEAVIKFNKDAPPLVKHVVSIPQKASRLTKMFVSEVQSKGVGAVVGQCLSEQAVKAWFMLNQVPTFHMVAEMAVPAAAHWSDKYNETVSSLAKQGYAVFSYLPLVPVEKISQAFKSADVSKGVPLGSERDAASH